MPTSATTPIYQPDLTPGGTPDYTRTIRDLQMTTNSLQATTNSLQAQINNIPPPVVIPAFAQVQSATIFNESGTDTTPYTIAPTVTLLILNTGPGPVPGTGDFILPPAAGATGPLVIYSGPNSIYNAVAQGSDMIENVNVISGGIVTSASVTGLGVSSGVSAVYFYPKAGVTNTWAILDFLG